MTFILIIRLSSEQDLQHNCSGTYDSEYGAALINKNGQLVEMNTLFHSDYMTAITTKSISELIATSEGIKFTVLFLYYQ